MTMKDVLVPAVIGRVVVLKKMCSHALGLAARETSNYSGTCTPCGGVLKCLGVLCVEC